MKQDSNFTKGSAHSGFRRQPSFKGPKNQGHSIFGIFLIEKKNILRPPIQSYTFLKTVIIYILSLSSG